VCHCNTPAHIQCNQASIRAKRLFPRISFSTNCLLICGYPERASSASFQQPPANS
jgi:hypothetical protein